MSHLREERENHTQRAPRKQLAGKGPKREREREKERVAMTQVAPFIGSHISLISKSDIRYEGTLYTIDTQESTLALKEVKSFGTEGR